MKKIIKIIGFIVIAVSIGFGFYVIHKDDVKTKENVYRLLEKNGMTEDEKCFVENITDPNFSKESFVDLDLEHRKMFKAHFGYER